MTLEELKADLLQEFNLSPPGSWWGHGIYHCMKKVKELTLPPTDHWIPGPPPEDDGRMYYISLSLEYAYYYAPHLEAWCSGDDAYLSRQVLEANCHIAVDSVAELLGGVRDDK